MTSSFILGHYWYKYKYFYSAWSFDSFFLVTFNVIGVFSEAFIRQNLHPKLVCFYCSKKAIAEEYAIFFWRRLHMQKKYAKYAFF